MGKFADRIRGTQQEKNRRLSASFLIPGYQPIAPPGGMPLPPEPKMSEEKTYPRHYRPRLEEWEVSNPFGKHKFIVVDHPQIGEVALCFPGYLVHADMADRIFSGLKVISAGFYNVWGGGEISTNGKSESIGVASRQDAVGKKKDEDAIAKCIGIG